MTVKPMSARARCLSEASTKHLSLAVDPAAANVQLVSSEHTSAPLCTTAATLADQLGTKNFGHHLVTSVTLEIQQATSARKKCFNHKGLSVPQDGFDPRPHHYE
jgi:hypothetical protein